MNPEMEWRSLAALLLFPVQMAFYVVKAAVSLLLPARPRELSRDTVLITGGGRGIGRHLAQEFAKRGARKIIIWGRTEKCLKEACDEIRSLGVECHYFVCDVGNKEAVYQQAKAVREKTTKAFLPRMLELQHGHIVCMNSVLALSAIPGAIDYCTSKSSSFAFMESLTLGLLDCPGVNATTVLPFHTSTEMFRGMKTRFPKLFPPLNPETVARRTVEAVRTNQAFLLLPWTMHLLVIMKSILPQTALEEIYRFTGSYLCMESFKGRT
ncbi:short-chain dehydrogenase/reductase 3b isoform X2 [Scyliorhinus torazame]|uniref:short-chain dehydrogenase/reductase 3b isoform X2 n=1 Tax=Scyliorhinus torazame TaxID=75743 RepID=UPI003B5A89AD